MGGLVAYILIHIMRVKLDSALLVSPIEASYYLYRVTEFTGAEHSQHCIFVSDSLF